MTGFIPTQPADPAFDQRIVRGNQENTDGLIHPVFSRKNCQQKEASMFARVTTVQGSPNRMDEGICYFQEQVVPTVEALDGFQGAYLMINRKSGKTVRITLWETEEAQQASAAVVAQIRREGAEVLRDWRDPLPDQPVIEVYEVAVKARSKH